MLELDDCTEVLTWRCTTVPSYSNFWCQLTRTHFSFFYIYILFRTINMKIFAAVADGSVIIFKRNQGNMNE